MRRNLTPEDLGDLLDRPIVAALATRRANGETLLSPVWHEWHDGGFNLFSFEGDVKVRHLDHDPSASIVVFESEPPYRGIEVRGIVTMQREGVDDICARIRARYESAEEDDDEEIGKPVLIRLCPGQLRAWDYVDEFED